MSTLLLRLAAPLQAWGVEAKFDHRYTQTFPSKSAVIGLLTSALGRRRHEDLTDLNTLRMGIRIDQEGSLLKDFHIAQREGKDPYVTRRYYLSDAVFLVGLEGDDLLLNKLAEALNTPFFPLFLGRWSCPPAGRLLLGIREGKGLEEALVQEAWLASPWFQRKNQGIKHLQLVLEVLPGTPGSFTVRDLPLSFDQAHRQYGFRSIKTDSARISQREQTDLPAGVDTTLHDAMMDWGDA